MSEEMITLCVGLFGILCFAFLFAAVHRSARDVMAVSYGDHCQGKVAFASHELASQVRNRKHKSKAMRGGLQVYRCQFCRQWHLGSARRDR